jgi:hypothetical protein
MTSWLAGYIVNSGWLDTFDIVACCQCWLRWEADYDGLAVWLVMLTMLGGLLSCLCWITLNAVYNG